MFSVRKAQERGHLNFGWLDTNHTFSFGHYLDPKHMGYRNLRVINDDCIIGGSGFDTHPHRDMEIVTFVKEGALAHKDTLGNESVIKPGEIQLMSAGTGIQHSEFNALRDGDTKFYQIWILPKEKGIDPRYDQHSYEDRRNSNDLTLLVSPEGGEGVARINANAKVFLGAYEEGSDVSLNLKKDGHYWVQLIDGMLDLGGEVLNAGDGVAIESEDILNAKAVKHSNFLFFELE